jgi:hypothetical protein
LTYVFTIGTSIKWFGNIHNRGKTPVAAERGGLDGTDIAPVISDRRIVRGAALHAGSDERAFRATAVPAGLEYRGHQQGDVGVLLHKAVQRIHRACRGRGIARAADVIFFYQVAIGLIRARRCIPDKQLADFFFQCHAANRLFDPADILIPKIEGRCFEIDHGDVSLRSLVLPNLFTPPPQRACQAT